MADPQDDLAPLTAGPPFPGAVKAAAVLWLAFGVLGFATSLVGFSLQAQRDGAAKQAGANPPPNLGGCCGIALTAAFVAVGFNTLKGKARDTLGNGIGSLVLAVLYLLLAGGGALIALGSNQPGAKPLPIPPGLLAVLAVLGLLVAGTLGTAGVLALVGRRQYLDWRAYHHPAGRR